MFVLLVAYLFCFLAVCNQITQMDEKVRSFWARLRLPGAGRVPLDHADVNLVGTGAAFYLYWHLSCPFFGFYFRWHTRSLALRARGLETNSWAPGVTGRLVSSVITAS